MKEAAKRPISRWIHIVFSIPILGYIYSPFERLPGYAAATRFVFLPLRVHGIVDVERPHRSTILFRNARAVICMCCASRTF
jgi:hypothetical protein